MSETPEGARGHWFTDREVDVLLYKVNRRLRARNTLFEILDRENQPPDPLRHVQQNLSSFRPTAESGRRFKRDWQVGNLALSEGDVLVGRLGWHRSDQALSTVFDEDAQEWVDLEVAGESSGVAPFALIADGRILGVMRHPSFEPKIIAKVFTDLLNTAEVNRNLPTTDFDVEPVGDRNTFFAWLNEVDVVSQVEFTFKRPNPDAEDSFQELFERQDAYQADEIREVIKSSGPYNGLRKAAIREDRVAAMFLAAAMAAYGYVTAKGRNQGRKARFDQRESVAREAIADVGDSWEAATAEVVEAVRRGRERRRSDGRT